MCKALDVDGYDDPRVATISERVQHRELTSELIDMCYAHAANMSMDEATARFEAERVPFSMILSPAELVDDPHAVAVGLFEVHPHHVVGRARLPRHPTQFSATPARLELGSPALGEHTDAILGELGLGEQVGALRAAGVVA
jgi:crotonobetainyl-CoA:carnitine CoA-transferase CaiB-like acyl-CoA transferase